MAQRPHAAPKARSGSEVKRALTAERSGFPFVQWRDSGGALAILELPPGSGRVAIGRDEDADIVLDGDPQVSRIHAVLDLVGGEWTLLDDGFSTNGSYVNGARVRARQRLRDHDRIVLGGSELLYRSAGRRAADETVPVGESARSRYVSQSQRKVLVSLCRPVHMEESATPATNRQIADELNMSVDAVKSHLRGLYWQYELGDLPQNQKRAQLAASVLVSGVIAPHEF
jgi:hypothetical protein